MIKKNVFYLLLVLGFFSCLEEGSQKSINKKEIVTQTMDGIEAIPDWLKFEISNTLPSDSLNIWVPTNSFQTSAMIRVPRFPIEYQGERLKKQPYDMKRYEIHLIKKNKVLALSSVKNEQVSAQIAVAAKQNISNLTVMASDFVSEGGEKIHSNNVQIRYVKYVPVQRSRSELSWSFRPEEIYGLEVSGFGMPDVVADPLMELDQVNVPAYRAQPVWFTFFIPKNTKAGTYKGNINMVSKEFQNKKIPITIEVLENEIPDAKDYKFYLDLWMNPKAIAVAHNLELWSEKHWELVGKYMEDLVSRGAKTITTIITHDPFQIGWLEGTRSSQTGIGFAPMIQFNLLKDNTWSYDYSIFDRFVELALKKDLSERIDVFTLTPFGWGGKQYIVYYDEAKNERVELGFDEFNAEYNAHWKRFLKDFEKHLRKKGWFEKTYLSFDESPKEVIESILQMVSESAPDFLNRFSIAGKPHTSSLAQSLSIFYPYFSLDYNKEKPIEKLLAERKEANKTTTVYLCGEPAHPNTFTYSPAIESKLVPWLALKMNVDGYLRWAYNSWSHIDPYKNPVFNFIQGDDYYIYPGEHGPVSSIRWELLKEGIEDFELFKIVKETGNVSEENLQKAINLATRNEDGRLKKVNDFVNARDIILQEKK